MAVSLFARHLWVGRTDLQRRGSKIFGRYFSSNLSDIRSGTWGFLQPKASKVPCGPRLHLKLSRQTIHDVLGNVVTDIQKAGRSAPGSGCAIEAWVLAREGLRTEGPAAFYVSSGYAHRKDIKAYAYMVKARSPDLSQIPHSHAIRAVNHDLHKPVASGCLEFGDQGFRGAVVWRYGDMIWSMATSLELPKD